MLHTLLIFVVQRSLNANDGARTRPDASNRQTVHSLKSKARVRDYEAMLNHAPVGHYSQWTTFASSGAFNELIFNFF